MERISVLSQQSKVRAPVSPKSWVDMTMAAPIRSNRDADRSFTRYIGTVANSSLADRGLGGDKTFRISIRCVATVCRELCVTK